jgi:creatinine amidohydrolase
VHNRLSILSWYGIKLQTSKNLFDEWSGLGHGGDAETSAMLSVRSDLLPFDFLDMKNAPEKRIPKLLPNIRIYSRFNELTRTGARGAPKESN